MPHKPYIIVWPAEEAVEGIYVAGHCIRPRGSLASNVNAHAHCSPRDRDRGYICCRPSHVPRLGTLADIDTDTPYIVYPGILALHELAHILDTSPGHGLSWRTTLLGLATRYPGMGADLEIEATGYERRAMPAHAALAQGHFLIGQRVKVAASARPVALRGQVAIVTKVGRTRLNLAFERADELGKWARYNYWPARCIEPADRPEPNRL